MHEKMKQKLTPQQYVRQLFAETREGKLEITCRYPDDYEAPHTAVYAMDWTAADAETLAQGCETLTAMLRRLGQLEKALAQEADRKTLLTPEELQVWEIFIRPFSPFEVDEAVIAELYRRGEYDTLNDEENALLERHWQWRERSSLARLPYLRRSPADLILRARRYEKLVCLQAPEVVIQEEGRHLAEELVLYCCGPQQTQTIAEEM